MVEVATEQSSNAFESPAPAAAELGTDMVSAAEMVTFQEQLRQEMADVIQQFRKEMNETVNGRIDMLSINTALQNVSAKPAASKPYRISDLMPRNWEGSNDK